MKCLPATAKKDFELVKQTATSLAHSSQPQPCQTLPVCVRACVCVCLCVFVRVGVYVCVYTLFSPLQGLRSTLTHRRGKHCSRPSDLNVRSS